MFANGPGDLGSIPGRVIPKTQKMVLDASLLNTQHYKVRIKGKVEQSREGVAPSPTPWCSSYRKGSLRVTLDYGRQLYLLLYKWLFETMKLLEKTDFGIKLSNKGWHAMKPTSQTTQSSSRALGNVEYPFIALLSALLSFRLLVLARVPSIGQISFIWFHGIGYLMPYIYIKYIWFVNIFCR